MSSASDEDENSPGRLPAGGVPAIIENGIGRRAACNKKRNTREQNMKRLLCILLALTMIPVDLIRKAVVGRK